MSDYIKREDAIQANVSQVEFCKSEGLDFSGKLHIDSIINNLKHIPAADVAERKRGKWMEAMLDHEAFGVRPTTHYCSECHQIISFRTFYCPNCGAEMRGEDDV